MIPFAALRLHVHFLRDLSILHPHHLRVNPPNVAPVTSPYALELALIVHMRHYAGCTSHIIQSTVA